MTEQSKTKDPGTIFQEYVNEVEGNWSHMWDQMVASPWYSKFQGNLMDTILSTHQASQANIRRYLESLNIPSKDDVARVVGQVIQAEEKISRLEQELYRLKDIEAKLDALLGNHEEASASRTTPKTGARTTSKTGSRPRARAKDEAPGESAESRQASGGTEINASGDNSVITED